MADIDFSTALNTYNAVDSGDPSAIAAAAGQVVPGGIGGLGEGVTIGEAAMGDPAAILKLVTNPQAAVDFVKNYNPITTTGDIVSVFSANGVSADFFSRYPFLAFLDNSTYHWKSRQPVLRAMTPAQRCSWFAKGFSDGSFGVGDAVLYNSFFGNEKTSSHFVSYDPPNLTFQLAQAYNNVMVNRVFPNGATTAQDGPWVRHKEDYLIDITQTKDYADVLAQLRAQAQAKYNAYQAQQAAALAAQQAAANTAKMEKIGIIVFIVLLIAVIIYFITQKK